MRLEGKKAVVTGGGGGIGRGIIRAFAREGAQICVVDVNDEVTKQGLDDAGEGAHFALAADVTSETDAENVVQTAIERMGRVDILVNCHGRPSALMGNPIDNITLEEWNAVFNVNSTGVFLMCRAVAAHMRDRKYGKIINLASLAARRANENVPHYCASKAAMISLTKSLAISQAPRIRVNAVAPGVVNTRWVKGWDEFVRVNREATPLKRVAEPEDIANAILSLVTNEYVTGQVMVVDGGKTI